MADISFYQYLEAAFRYKLKHNAAASFKDLHYSLPYESKGASRGIFEYARKVLPTFYSLHFPDTEEGHLQMAKDFIEKLDRHKDPELERYFDPARTPKEHAQTIAEAQASSQQAEPAPATPAGGMPFGMPAAEVIPSAPRRVFAARQTAPSGGMEGGTGQGTAATNKINRQAVKSSASSAFGKIQNFTSPAGPFFKINSERVARGLGDIAKGIGRGITGGIGGGLGAAAPSLGRIGHGLAGGLQRISRPGGIGSGGISKLSKSSSKFALAFVGAMILLVLLGGVIGSLGETAPAGDVPITPTGTDILSCKFTRAGDSQPIKSSTLASWINQAAASADIPPAILASVARHESPDFFQTAEDASEEIKNNRFCNPGKDFCISQDKSTNLHLGKCNDEEISQGNSNTKAIGLMQIVEAHYPGVDLCNIQTNIALAAQIFKGKLGTGSVNNEADLKKAVCLYFGAKDDTECTYEGKYHYGQEAWTDYRNCQTASSAIPPLTDGNYQKWPENIGIKMADGFTPEVYKWAYEILYQATTISPKFKDLIHQQCPQITFEPTAAISHAEGCAIPLSFGGGEEFFKFLIIHELGHKINTTSHQYNSQIIAARISDALQDTKEGNGFLTYYSQHAASAADKICGEGNEDNRADEEFADSMAYYINSLTKEQNMRNSECGTKWPDNPFQQGNRYTAHYNLITKILK